MQTQFRRLPKTGRRGAWSRAADPLENSPPAAPLNDEHPGSVTPPDQPLTHQRTSEQQVRGQRPAAQSTAGQRIRTAVVRALARLAGTGEIPSASHPAPALSQSSASSVDLSPLWNQESDRLTVYRDADLMDAESDLTNAALNAWASTATSGAFRLPAAAEGEPIGSETTLSHHRFAGGHLRIIASDRRAQEIVDGVCSDCHLSTRAWSFARDLRKYGDRFLEVAVDDSLRVRRLKSLPPGEMIRCEDEFGRLEPVAFRQVRNGIEVARFAPWQIVHLRNNRQGDEKYGRSGLRTARRVWRMLNLLEDSLVSARLQRAYSKNIHFIPVADGATTGERLELAQQYIRMMTTSTLIDPLTGNLDQRSNPANVRTDFYLTVAPGDHPKTGVQLLDPANSNLSHLDDMEYFQNLMVAGLEVPKAYLGLERDVNSKATLGYQEIHFLRQAGSLQNSVNAGIASVLELALALAGIDPGDVELRFDYGGE